MSLCRRLLTILITITGTSIGLFSYISVPLPASAGTIDTSGRLGGDRASFDLAYADQQPVVTGSGTLFSFDDLGLFLVNFQARTLEPAPTDIAAVIVISSPRDASLAADTPDRSDWTTDEALETALRFLPSDAVVGAPDATPAATPTGGDESGTASCQSDVLAVTDYGPGFASGEIGCQVALIQPTADTVSYLTLSLTLPGTASPQPDPCAGMSDWATTTGEHLTTAETLIASIDALDLTSVDAPAQLGEIADDLRDVAERQRELTAPPPAARAQLALTTALDDYAAALEQAATAIATADNTLLGQAVDLVSGARDGYVTADDRVLLALRACSLALSPG